MWCECPFLFFKGVIICHASDPDDILLVQHCYLRVAWCGTVCAAFGTLSVIWAQNIAGFLPFIRDGKPCCFWGLVVSSHSSSYRNIVFIICFHTSLSISIALQSFRNVREEFVFPDLGFSLHARLPPAVPIISEDIPKNTQTKLLQECLHNANTNQHTDLTESADRCSLYIYHRFCPYCLMVLC